MSDTESQSLLPSGSESDSDLCSQTNLEDMLMEEPMYYVLAQFLTTPVTKKSLAQVAEELTQVLKEIRDVLREGLRAPPRAASS